MKYLTVKIIPITAVVLKQVAGVVAGATEPCAVMVL